MLLGSNSQPFHLRMQDGKTDLVASPVVIESIETGRSSPESDITPSPSPSPPNKLGKQRADSANSIRGMGLSFLHWPAPACEARRFCEYTLVLWKIRAKGCDARHAIYLKQNVPVQTRPRTTRQWATRVPARTSSRPPGQPRGP